MNTRWPRLLEKLRASALPDREEKARKEADSNAAILARKPDAKLKWPRADALGVWWTLWRRRPEMLAAVGGLERFIALTRTTSFERGPVFTFVDGSFRPTDGVVVFPFDDDYSLGILQSEASIVWYRERCTTMKVDPNYTTTTVGDTFTWPQNPAPAAVDRVAAAAASIVAHRAEAFRLGCSLAAQYDMLRGPGQSTLRTLHEELDGAVLEAYRFDPDQDLLVQLLALNLLIAECEGDGEQVTQPGPQPSAVHASRWAWPAPVLRTV